MKGFILGLAILHGADASVTLAALKSGQAREVVRWMPTHPAGVLGIHAGAVASETWVIHTLETRGHRKAVTVLKVLAIGTQVGIVASNAYQLQQIRKRGTR